MNSLPSIQSEAVAAFMRESSVSAQVLRVSEPAAGRVKAICSALASLVSEGITYRVAASTGKVAKRVSENGLECQTVQALLVADEPPVAVLLVLDGETLTSEECAALPSLARRTVIVVDSDCEQRLPPLDLTPAACPYFPVVGKAGKLQACLL